MKRWIVLVVVTIIGGVGMAAAAGLLGAPVPLPWPGTRPLVPTVKPAFLPLPMGHPVLDERIETERLIDTQA